MTLRKVLQITQNTHSIGSKVQAQSLDDTGDTGDKDIVTLDLYVDDDGALLALTPDQAEQRRQPAQESSQGDQETISATFLGQQLSANRIRRFSRSSHSNFPRAPQRPSPDGPGGPTGMPAPPCMPIPHGSPGPTGSSDQPPLPGLEYQQGQV